MNNPNNDFKKVSGVIIDSEISSNTKATKTGLGEVFISDRVSSVKDIENQSFVKKFSDIKGNNPRSDLEIKLHAKLISKLV